MIRVINNINDPLISLIKDDPVRSNIPASDRVSLNKEILVLLENDTPSAVVCISYQDDIPSCESELISSNNATIAVFYTIWSYKSGAGKELIFQAKKYIEENKPNIKKFVTLSPQTDLARKFHMSNGAKELRVNKDSINYGY